MTAMSYLNLVSRQLHAAVISSHGDHDTGMVSRSHQPRLEVDVGQADCRNVDRRVSCQRRSQLLRADRLQRVRPAQQIEHTLRAQPWSAI